jgi:peptidoglycan/xylan/chitin deacetylase (PgdA/CDA1 family)
MIEQWTAPVRRLAGRIARPGNSAAILAYHRVARLRSDPQLLASTPEHFEEQLAQITYHYRAVSLSELAKAIASGEVPDKAVAVTFDDGYSDNLSWALPLLKKYEVPATVFVTSGYMGQEREFWWDDLERILLLNANLPETLEIKIKGRPYKWTFGKALSRDLARESRWNVMMSADPSPYHKAYKELHTLLKPLDHAERLPIMDDLCRWADLSVVGRREYMAISEAGMKALASDGIVDLGAHTVTHPMLSAMSREAQQLEITECKKRLEAVLGRSVSSFSYPFGTRADVGRIAPRLARDAGYGLACANYSGLAGRHSDPYLLPRLLVRDWDGQEFARRLKGWFDE